MKKIFPLFAVIIVLVLAVCSFHIIPTGYTGVKTSFGQIKETTIQSGKLNFCIPFVQSIPQTGRKPVRYADRLPEDPEVGWKAADCEWR